MVSTISSSPFLVDAESPLSASAEDLVVVATAVADASVDGGVAEVEQADAVEAGVAEDS